MHPTGGQAAPTKSPVIQHQEKGRATVETAAVTQDTGSTTAETAAATQTVAASQDALPKSVQKEQTVMQGW